MSVDPVLRLIEVTRSISAILDPEELVQGILTSAAEMLGAERGYLLLVTPNEEEPARGNDSRELSESVEMSTSFNVRATYRLKVEELDAHEFRASRSTILRVFRTGAAHYKQDALSEEDRSRSVELFGLRSILCEPLKVGQKLVGVLYLDSRVHNRFSPWCREILPSLAAQAAICIENANLVSQREEALKREHSEQLHAQEMETWKNALAAFVSVASHDLRSPLTALQGGLALLESYNLGAEVQPVLEDMKVSLRRARRLVEMYLDVSNLQQDRRIHLEKRPTNLYQLVEEEARFVFEHLSSQKRQLFSFHNHIPQDLIIPADPHRMAQIFGNLLENATKYGKGQIEVHCKRLDELGQVEIVVSDQGPGLLPEEAARVFERHYRAESSIGTNGTGLGLWIVAQLVQSHGGHIRAVPKTETPQGAAFVLRIPAE